MGGDAGEYPAPLLVDEERADDGYQDEVGVAPVIERQGHQLMQRHPKEREGCQREGREESVGTGHWGSY
jgi:hypothetical protein